jgi:hypothetical protein
VNKRARKFIIESNVIYPILNLVNIGDNEVINDWFDILTMLAQDDDFLDQYGVVENLELLLFRMLKNGTAETNHKLISFLSGICKSQKI